MIPANEPLTAEEWEELHPDDEPGPNAEWMDDMKSWAGANLVIPNLWEDDRQEEWLAIAVWRLEKGLEVTPRDREALLWSAKATLARELPSRPDGGQTVVVTPKEQRRRELEATYLVDTLNLTNINAAALMGWGIDKGMIAGLAAGGRARCVTAIPVTHLDGELMMEIKEKHRKEQEKAKTNARLAAQYTPRKRKRK